MNEEQIEKLLKKWGENKEPNHKNIPLPVLVALGYKIGQQWAVKQKRGRLFDQFEEFYNDWANDRLTKARYKLLYNELNPASIVAEMSDTLDQAIVDPNVAEALLENYHLFEKGVVWGLMSFIREIIKEGR